MGNLLLSAGIVLIIAGIAYKLGLLNWFGNLPGDIKYEGENTRVFFPITTMIVVSIILSVAVAFFRD